MHRKSLAIYPLLLTIFVLALTTASFAAPIQDRMKARIPAITDLKNREIIGENNQGYLSFLNKGKEKEDLVKAENQDRSLVYQEIGKKNNVDAKLVGQRRAAQLAESGVKGHWYQNTAGKWIRK